MLLSKYFLPTLKETPADAELTSHRLMLRAGMIRKLASGVYTWLPLGYRVLAKVEQIIRQEMAKIDCQEMLMPAVLPSELWVESGRWDKYGKELLKFTDRHERDFCIGPTHEEVVTDVMRHELKSYKQLPLSIFQIQTKFRDEIRPRFGVMRGREFMMKDAYSFHMDQASLQQTYDAMYQAYANVLDTLGLQYRAVLADTGSIGGDYSHEFQVLANSGEDVVVYCEESDYAANLEKATALVTDKAVIDSKNTMEKFATPTAHTIADLAEQHDCPAHRGVKTLVVKGVEAPLIALILRGDHSLNEIKAGNLADVLSPLTMATDEEIKAAIGASVGSLGPVGLSIPYIVDRDAAVLVDFVCGANEDGQHYRNVNWERDASLSRVEDLRNVEPGDMSPDGKGELKFTRGIEVGQVFQLQDKYTQSMSLTVLDENGKAVMPLMGCYGMGVSRLVAAAIEQHHDERGIIWPEAMAPFQIALVPVQMHKSYRVREIAELLYEQLQAAGIEVLFDDRRERPGVMFANMDLIGIPHRIVIGERGLDDGVVEYKRRVSDDSEHWSIDEVLSKVELMLNR